MRLLAWASVALAGCVTELAPPTPPAPLVGTPALLGARVRDGAAVTLRCGGSPMSVTFFDVGQALAAQVALPDGRRILVDAGEAPDRAGCGEPCRRWSAHLTRAVTAPLALLFITHQHSDHVGNAPHVLRTLEVGRLVDNGTNLGSRPVEAMRSAARERRVRVEVIAPGEGVIPLEASTGVSFRAVVPSAWPSSCERHPNDCSIGLRIDYCESSVLFTGDAEEREEKLLDPLGPVTLLQVGHHGSETSSSAAFLERAAPRVAVISAAKPGEGTNRTYCHPRALAVERLTRALGGATRSMRAFTGTRCRGAGASAWADVPASDRLYLTARDGDVVLVTTGDGTFERR